MLRKPAPLLAFLISLAGPMAAQRAAAAAPWFPRFAPQLQHEAHTGHPVAATPTFGDSSDYRYEGAIAGAIVFGGGMAYLSHGICEANCDLVTIQSGLAGALVGGLFGLLIGGMMTKAGDK